MRAYIIEYLMREREREGGMANTREEEERWKAGNKNNQNMKVTTLQL